MINIPEGWFYMLLSVLVLAQVDKYAEIEYSMVESPLISNSSIDLHLKVRWSRIHLNVKLIFSLCSFFLLLTHSLSAGGVLQHRAAQGAPVLPVTLLPAASGQRHAVYRIISFHPELSRLRVQQRRSAEPLRNRRHGGLQPPSGFFKLCEYPNIQ